MITYKSFLILSCSLLGCALSSCDDNQNQNQNIDFTSYVDPKIGTGGHGHVFYGANVPYGFVQVGPSSIPQEWDWVSGYHVSDSTIIGFPHTHLSGTGIGDLHDINVMPVVGDVTYARGTEKDQKSGLWSYSDRSKELVRPGYYKTSLLRYNIDVELTATKRVGFHKYTFPNSSDAAIVFDMVNGGCWDRPEEAMIRVVNDSIISGYRYSSGWASNQKVYFVAHFSKPFTGVDYILNDKLQSGDSACGQKLFARVNFDTNENEPVYLKVALSPTSESNAALNMKSELPGWDFNQAVASASAAWNSELSKIEVETSDEKDKTIFYTSLYHTMFAPSVFCDVDGSYYGADHKMHDKASFVNYTTFSLWDTYRAAQPLMTIVHPEKMNDIINTMIHIFQQQGKLPVWHLMGCETDCMVGNPGIPVVADAILKGFDGFDIEQAYTALKESAMLPERGMQHRIKYGFIPSDLMKESIAYDMEYALADWCVAQVAQMLGKDEDAAYFMERSKSYKRYFDSSVGFMRGRLSDGSVRIPFNPYASTHRDDDYCEGNAWQYTWLAPHDVEGLVECFGGSEPFVSKLDSLFIADGDMGGTSSPDITGLIGQYAHGNEPSHHIAYLYTLVGQPWKTADKVREILKTMYSDKADGLSGNEDVGQMSAWYVLSSMGFYQVQPAGGRFVIGYPLFDKVSIKVPAGKFNVLVKNRTENNTYIQKVLLNGKEYSKPWIEYSDIMSGGTVEFIMGDKPVSWY